VAAARDRFVSAGYANTSITGVAESAGVSPETIYDVFGNKRRLLEGVVEATIVGDSEEPIEPLNRRWVTQLQALPTLQERVDGFAAHTAQTLARMAPIHALVRAAASADASMADLPARMHKTRFETQRRILESLSHGESMGESATDTFSALTSPELHHLLTAVRGWSQARYQSWLRRTVIGALNLD
jgi:AcrR family transcriptional regulator